MRNFGTYFTGTAIISAKGPINEAGRCFSPGDCGKVELLEKNVFF